MAKPVVYISASAYAAACAEFERWAEHGRRRNGMAWEAVVYPLVGLVARPGMARSPLEPTPLDECAALVVPHVVVPPPALAHYGPTWARPSHGATRAGADELQARLDAVRAAHPRLDCYGRMHSHPWPHRQPHPSGTDCAEHLTGALESNRAAGLPWSLGLIAAPHECGMRNAECGMSEGSGIRDQGLLGMERGWGIQAYGLREGGALTPLGAAQVVPDSDWRVRQVLTGTGWATAAGQRWRARQQAALAAQEIAVMALPLHRGWYGFALRPPGGSVRVVALPPGFPAARPRVLDPALGGGWQPAFLAEQRSGWDGYSLTQYLPSQEAA